MRINKNFRVKGQHITCTDDTRIIKGNKNLYYAVFHVDELWDDIDAKACFTVDEEPYIMPLNRVGNTLECEIPYPANSGIVFGVGIFGGDLISTDIVYTSTTPGIPIDGANPPEPVPDWFNKMENIARQAMETANSVKEQADSGAFKGDPFTYDDFTEEQLKALEGKPGYTPQKNIDYFDGKNGDPGYTPQKGLDYFTAAEVAEIVMAAAAEAAGSITETDPTVPDWAKASEKPTYTAEEVGARPNTWTPSASEVGADPVGTAVGAVSGHNTAEDAHEDIRLLVAGLTSRLNALADSDDETLDQLSELVAYIKANRSLIEQITTGKVSVTDIVDNLTTNVANKPLSAAQGVVLKGLIDALSEEIVDQQAQIASLIVQGVQQTPSYPQGDTAEEQLAWLADNGDTAEIYLLDDGYLYAYKTVETAGGIEEVTEPITGEFTEDYRLSTSSGNLSQLVGAITTPLIDLTKYGDKVTIHLDGTSRDTVNWAATTAVTGNSIILYNDGAFAWGGYTGTTTHAGVTYTINERHDVDVFIDRTKISCTHVRFSGVTGRADKVSVSVTYEKETTGGTETKWASTGFTFTPADYESRIVKLETDTNNLKVRVNNLEASILTGDTVPEYVLTEAEEVADKVLAVRNADSFVMSLASDLHTNGTDTSAVGILHAGQAMNAINAITALDLVSLLGDYEVYDFSYGDGDTDGEDARKSHKYTNKVFSETRKGVPFIKLKGNHDYDADDAETVEQQKTYAYIGANNIGTITDYDNKSKVYGYRDFENYKIRVIYLNTSDGGSCSVSTEQLNWLNTVALNLSDGWLPIVLSHHPLNWDGMGSVLNALNTYKGTGKSIIHFHGHIHNFRAETLGTNNVLTVTIPNACFGRNNEYGTASSYSETIRTNFGDTDESGNQRRFNKTAGTAEDTAFNVVVVDRQNRKVHCFNYGAGIDRELSY